MNRTFLRWFYVVVQFVMLAVSIPKVATLFHAYDPETLGLSVGGIDVVSWCVGLSIDLCAAFTTWAAMAKYDESRKRSALLAPAVIIGFCTTLSVIANYESAATQHPAQYAGVSLFAQPALLVNPLLVSAPPVLVLLLILLVPSVLARPRLKSASEIAAETDEQVAKIKAAAEVRKAKAAANAQVRGVQLRGLRETVNSLRDAPEEPALPPTPIPDDPPDGDPPAATAAAKMSRALWQALKLPERVQQSGVITPQEVADVLGISVAHARNLCRLVTSGTQRVDGRSGVSYNDLIDTLYATPAKDSYARARKLEMALGVRKRPRQPLERQVIDESSELTEDDEAS